MQADVEFLYDHFELTPVTKIDEILRHLLEVSHAEPGEEAAIASLHGFIPVVKIDTNLSTCTGLSPSLGKIPSGYLVVEELEQTK